MIEAAITPKTKLVIINSPSNPSGAVLPREEFERIFAVTSKRNIWLMTDECYCRFLYDSEPFSIASVPGAKDTVIVAGSLSKTYAMTGLAHRLRPRSEARHRRHDEAPEPLHVQSDFDCAKGRRRSAARSAGLHRRHDGGLPRTPPLCHRPFAADPRRHPGPNPRAPSMPYPDISVAFGKKGIHSSMDFCERLLSEAHVAVVPGEAFGTSKHIRISYATLDA
jgi:aspartate aminotransferase